MNRIKFPLLQTWLALALFAAIPLAGHAQSDLDSLREKIDNLEMQLDAVEKQQNDTGAAIDAAAEWKYPNTLIHMAGYADVGYAKSEGNDGSFVLGSFSPIFHFQYRDIVMLEAELEIEIESDGETNLELEYAAIDWFFSDYSTLVAGKFLSPIGQFRQNLHPSWINKMPTAPPGFGHDGAAPVSDLGLQFRGGFPLGSMRATYAAYVSNGPELNSVTEDDIEFELEGIEAEAFGADRDGEKVFGGRFSLFPVAGLELGISAATGKASVTQIENETTETVTEVSGETARDYDVLGADFAWNWRGLGIRGEYVQTKIGAAITGTTASDGSKWRTWYTQAAYRIPGTKWEPVVRYTDFDSPHASEDQKQAAVGINYLFANNFIFKLAYEFNDGQTDAPANDDWVRVQLAYGF